MQGHLDGGPPVANVPPPVAFLLSGEMAIAYFLRYAFAARGVLPVTNGGEIPVLYCFMFLYFAFAGGGEWSLDAVLARRKPARA